MVALKRKSSPPVGLEPTTTRLKAVRSTNWAIAVLKGNTWIWTRDLLICSQLLYHWAIFPMSIPRLERGYSLPQRDALTLVLYRQKIFPMLGIEPRSFGREPNIVTIGLHGMFKILLLGNEPRFFLWYYHFKTTAINTSWWSIEISRGWFEHPTNWSTVNRSTNWAIASQ